MSYEAISFFGLFLAIVFSLAFPENDCLVLIALLYILGFLSIFVYLTYAEFDFLRAAIYLTVLILSVKFICFNPDMR